MELVLTIDPNPEIPVFRRLATAMREAIISQRLQPGQKVPSAKALADSFSLSRPTVVKVYKTLISQGYLEAKTGSGTFVSKRLSQPGTQVEQRKPLIAGHVSPNGISEYAQRISNIKFVEPTLAGMPELNYGSPPWDLLPREKWRELLMKYCRLRPPDQFDSADEVFGYLPLRSAIAAFLSRSKGVQCSAEQVILFEGSHAFAHVARLLIEPGDVAVVENPGYLGMRETLHAEGARLLAVDIDEDGPRIEALQRRLVSAKLCYLTCPYQIPTGAVMSLERQREVLSWAQENCTFIVEDAFDSDYHHGMPLLPALQGQDAADKVLYIYSFWKVLFPLCSLGVLVVPRSLIPLFERAKFLTNRQFPILEHFALTELISDGHLEMHIKRTSKIYQARRQKLIYALSQQFRNRIWIPRRSGGLHTLVQFKLDVKPERILRCAQESGFPLTSTADYYTREAGLLEYLVPFASMPDGTIEEVVERFARKLLKNSLL